MVHTSEVQKVKVEIFSQLPTTHNNIQGKYIRHFLKRLKGRRVPIGIVTVGQG